ncbi:hypothetical protein E2562_000444 [Oryza meyeriana var. granulata]|uniref:Uncharacterized protein n=1 Tax=Oryza meyeriana var. granulata TaxID=110450 RepID=A0A6G1CCF5_9ORYZ|nr:hypothetical protein E2562_000444 [Oryza meyeriana var. granulata]
MLSLSMWMTTSSPMHLQSKAAKKAQPVWPSEHAAVAPAQVVIAETEECSALLFSLPSARVRDCVRAVRFRAKLLRRWVWSFPTHSLAFPCAARPCPNRHDARLKAAAAIVVDPPPSTQCLQESFHPTVSMAGAIDPTAEISS